ncbi:MAG: phosphopantetheine adenylyltransferase [Gammaproteobacteria bacterium]|nr:phosphopantetheine adenylyltransferase [Gammaproteobacteria bacterium]MDH5304019.1 phosphopantetheine adenylyltransferase [Gammaproteobacteria bacterium]MDH5321664.1 phosphopantetheine adenylyltransferase [Gammaproteobacteria bacterium]
MKKLVTGALLIAGAINLYPLVGVISVDQLEKLYGVSLDNGDLIILMRHRAILFGLLGTFLIYAAFRNSIQVLACIAGLVSMISFIALAYTAGYFGTALNKAMITDVIGSVALVAVLLIRWMRPLPRESTW